MSHKDKLHPPNSNAEIGSEERVLWEALVSKGIRDISTISTTIDQVSIAANTVVTVSITVTGIKATDTLINLTKDLYEGVVIIHSRITNANTLDVTLENITGAPVDPASQTYTATIIR